MSLLTWGTKSITVDVIAHFRQVDVKIHLIYLLISIFLKRSEINFNKKLLNVDHNIINIYFITNGDMTIWIINIVLMILVFNKTYTKQQ
jgi:hypothetical protein